MILPPGDDEIDRALSEAQQRTFEKRESRFGADLLLWLAIAPVWPERVASRCSFPADLAVIGPALQAAGLAQSAAVAGPDGEDDTHWWMPAAARRDTLTELRRRRGGDLHRIAADIAVRLLAHGAEMPAVLARWAALASSAWQADRTLMQEVSGLVMRGDTGEALSWILAARFLAGALGGSLETGVALAERQIELAYRRDHDQQLLRSFVAREDQIGWVDELLAAPDDRWALHLLGVGGAGKTMLLRHVTARLAAERGVVAVRIDFDHLSPDYPLRKPGQLIAALAGELRVHATLHRQEYLFERLDVALADLIERLDAELPPADPLANVRRPEVRHLLQMFAEIVAQLPSRVLFILDTCEELAKLTVPGAGARVPPAVEATFYLLGELHERVPSARFLFAGRRFLASGGHGWEARSLDAEGTGKLPARTFLALEELRGFTVREADALFERFGLALDPARRDAVLSRSREVASPRVHRLDRPAEPEVDRYHPFDLALYAGWLQEEPDLPPSMLQGDADPYVERRILGRIESSELRELVPVVVLLRRFDRVTAAAALGRGGDDEDGRSLVETLRTIAAQEWVEVQPNDESAGVFYEVQTALWPRLWRFYSSEERRAELGAVMRRVGPELLALVDRTPAARLRVELISAAMRALRPREAGALWAAIEQRAAEEGALGRLRKIAESLLAEEGPAALPPGLLRVHVGLTCGGEQRGMEGEVASRFAGEGGDQAIREWLGLRSYAVHTTRLARHGNVHSEPWGVLARAVRQDTEAPAVDHANRASVFRSAVLRASVAEALDAGLDVARRQGGRPSNLGLPPEDLSRWADALAARGEPVDQVAWARLLSARAHAMEGHWSDVDALFAKAIDEAERADTSLRTPVLEGQGPPSFAVRARLELASFDPLRSVGYVHDFDAPDPDGDRRRLLAHELLVRLAQSSGHRVASEELAKVEACSIVREVDVRAPLAEAARRVPPPFVAAARVLAASGRPSQALEVLDRAIDQGLKTADSALATRAAEREKLAILRRFRAAPGELAERLAREVNSDTGSAARSYLTLARRPHSKVTGAPGPSTSSPTLAAATLPGRPPSIPPAAPPFDAALRGDRSSVEGIVRQALRDPAGIEQRAWPGSLPPRFVADLALEEGEVLAIDQPGRGAALFDLSHAWFVQAGDPIGALFASTLRLAAGARAGQDAQALRRIWSNQVDKEYDKCERLLGWPPLVTTPEAYEESTPGDPQWEPWKYRFAAWRGHFAGPGDLEAHWTPLVSSFFMEFPENAAVFPGAVQEMPPPVEARDPVEPAPRIEPVRKNESVAGPPGMAPAAQAAPGLVVPPPTASARKKTSNPDERPAAPVKAAAPAPPAPRDTAPGQSPGKEAPSADEEDEPRAAEPPPPDNERERGGLGIVRRILSVLGRIFDLIDGSPEDDEEEEAKSDVSPAASLAPEAETPVFDPSRIARVELEMLSDDVVHLRIPRSRSSGWTFPLPRADAASRGEPLDVPQEAVQALEHACRHSAVGLEIKDTRLAGIAWEGLVPPHGASSGALGRLVLRVTERVAPRSAGGGAALLASESWSSHFAAAMSSSQPVILSPGSRMKEPTGLVCVVGKPFSPSTGVVFRVSGRDDGPTRKVAVQQKGGGDPREGELLRPDSHAVFGAPVVVLVPEPVEWFKRGTAERDQAAMMRTLAHGVARRAGVVLVLPALPSSVAAEAVSLVTSRLPECDGVADLLALTTALRDLVLHAAAEDGGDEPVRGAEQGQKGLARRWTEGAEAALEVVLYVSVPPRGRPDPPTSSFVRAAAAGAKRSPH